MTEIYTYTGTLVIEECCNCGCTFGISQDKHNRCKNYGENFYCPNGHSMVYKKTELQKQKAEAARLAEELSRANERARRNSQDAQHYKRSRDTYKGQVTKIKNRVGRGVCPCCTRTFENLARHIETQHPGYVENPSEH